MLQGLSRDLRLAARRLAATPLFTIFAVLSLAVGVGVTTAVYSVVDSVLLKDLGIREPQNVVFVMVAGYGRLQLDLVSRPDFEDLRTTQESFASIAASLDISAAVVSPVTTEALPAEAVDGAYFSTLGVKTVLGRLIQPSDEKAASPVAVLSYRLWRSRFASDPKIVGQTVRVSGYPFEIIGVVPESFEGPVGWLRGTRLWVPLAVAPLISPASLRSSARPERDKRRLTVVGRLRPGRTVETASAELANISASLDAAYPRRSPVMPRAERRAWKAESLANVRDRGDILRRFGLIIVGLVALVLVVACTNLANLVLARGTMRQHEFAVRRALGASRWRLVREQCAESLLIAVGGAAASAVVIQVLRVATDVDLPLGASWMLSVQPRLNTSALVAAAAAVALSLVVFGLEPAMQLTRARDIHGQLAGSGGLPKTRRQRLLLRWQVAISTGFFIIATMCVKYTIAEARHDSGVDMERLGVAIMNFDEQRWDEDRVRRALDRVMEEARKDPAVQTVAASTGLPFGTPRMPWVTLSTTDTPIGRGDDAKNAVALAATPSIFRTIGVPILRGRAFDDRDHAGAAPVVVLSERTARTMFGTADAVGRQLVVRQQWARVPDATTATVVGIARETDVGGLFVNRDLVYLPFAQRYGSSLTVTARATGDPAVAVRVLRGAIRKVDPDIAIEVAGTGPAVLGRGIVFLRAAGMLALALGGLTLLLAMVGLYGIQSHIVAHRTREIGVRMSLGATAAQIKRLVLKDGYRPVFEGLGIGLFIGLAGRAIVRFCLVAGVQAAPGNWIARISIVDPWILATVPIPLMLAAFWACYLPASRAARVDPNVALRTL